MIDHRESNPRAGVPIAGLERTPDGNYRDLLVADVAYVSYGTPNGKNHMPRGYWATVGGGVCDADKFPTLRAAVMRVRQDAATRAMSETEPDIESVKV
jgi:hypothetical protein